MISPLVDVVSPRQICTTWTDDVSGAFITETANFSPISRTVSCAIEVSAYRPGFLDHPLIHGRLEKSKLLIPEVKSQNRDAAAYLAGLKNEHGLDDV